MQIFWSIIFWENDMNIWNNDEVKNLFSEVENCKKENLALGVAFKKHAEKYGRKANSVRNYYYAEVENLKKDTKRCQKLKIDLSKHNKNHFILFEKHEEENLVSSIEGLVKNGQSVRSACKKLSGGDLTLMTRLQNKYQNLTKKRPDNIITFKKQQILTESDINSLFMGLIKLVKKSAIDEFTEKMRLEKEASSFLLKRAFLDLGKKEKQIVELRTDFETLKSENQKLQKTIKGLEFSKNQKLKKKLEKRANEKVLQV